MPGIRTVEAMELVEAAGDVGLSAKGFRLGCTLTREGLAFRRGSSRHRRYWLTPHGAAELKRWREWQAKGRDRRG